MKSNNRKIMHKIILFRFDKRIGFFLNKIMKRLKPRMRKNIVIIFDSVNRFISVKKRINKVKEKTASK